jgi:hypothetical protein
MLTSTADRHPMGLLAQEPLAADPAPALVIVGAVV